jgi:hypothetical protein
LLSKGILSSSLACIFSLGGLVSLVVHLDSWGVDLSLASAAPLV